MATDPDPCSGCAGRGFWTAAIGNEPTRIYCWCTDGDRARRADGLLVPGEQAELGLGCGDATPREAGDDTRR